MNELDHEIEVRYSCRACGLRDIAVAVPARPSEMDVRRWFDRVMIYALARDHDSRSPRCHPESLNDIKIPLEGREWIGGPLVQ